MSRKPQIVVYNHSTVVSDAEVQAACAALQIQVSRDFYAVWGVDAIVMFGGPRTLKMPGAWEIAILDDADQAGALGYHDFTADGAPLGKVFAKTTKDDGASWTVCFSHELLEMLGDPDIIRTVFAQDTNTSGVIYAYEVCDAVEDDVFGYLINGVRVSDFVTPAWFEVGAKHGPFSFRNNVSAPLELAAGGYIAFFRVPNQNGWEQRFADGKAAARIKHADPRGRRHERRARERASRVRSTAA